MERGRLLPILGAINDLAEKAMKAKPVEFPGRFGNL
jgi:hypothetical protein